MIAEWFGSMGRTWGATPLEDQYAGGGIAWSIGEIPTLILAITVAQAPTPTPTTTTTTPTTPPTTTTTTPTLPTLPTTPPAS